MNEAEDLLRQVTMGIYTEQINACSTEVSAKANVVAKLTDIIMEFIKSSPQDFDIIKPALAPAIHLLNSKLKEDITDAALYEQYVSLLVTLRGGR